jgi:anti-anti-sigma factor
MSTPHEHHQPQPDGERGPFSVHGERNGSQYAVRVSGELDLAARDELEHELRRAEASDADRILVDLTRLEFIDSSGLRTLLEAQARNRRDGDRLAILRAPSRVQRVFAISGLEKHLPFTD